MAGRDVFSVRSGKRAVVDNKIHGQRRFGYFLKRNGRRLIHRTDGISDMKIGNSRYCHDGTDVCFCDFYFIQSVSPDSYKVSGRGELHLSVLIENMRREGYEFAVSKAEVLYHTNEAGQKTEPMELAYIDVPDDFTGAVISKLSTRKGNLLNMKSISGGYTRLEFRIPSRGLIGYRGEFLTDTKGNGIINTIFDGYDPYCGDIAYRKSGSLIAFETGESVTYGLFAAQDRGTLFIGPGEKVYSGMIIGSSSRAEDIEINVCKKKHLTNTRSSSADEALTLTPPKTLSLEQAIDFIDVDELLEVTPNNLRIRKRILDSTLRKRANLKK